MSAIDKFINKNKRKQDSKNGSKQRSLNDLDHATKSTTTKTTTQKKRKIGEMKKMKEEDNLLEQGFESQILTQPELFVSHDSSKDLLPIIKQQLKHLYEQQQQENECKSFWFVDDLLFFLLLLFCGKSDLEKKNN